MTDKIEQLARSVGIKCSGEVFWTDGRTVISHQDLSKFRDACIADYEAEREKGLADTATDELCKKAYATYYKAAGDSINCMRAAITYALSRVRPPSTDGLIEALRRKQAKIDALEKEVTRFCPQDSRAVELAKMVDKYAKLFWLDVKRPKGQTEILALVAAILKDEQPRETVAGSEATPCCGGWEFCRKMCVPRADHWKEYAKSLELPQPAEGKQPIKRGRRSYD